MVSTSNSSSNEENLLGEKTPLLISVPSTNNDITPATSATTTPESSAMTIATATTTSTATIPQHQLTTLLPPKSKLSIPKGNQKHSYLQQKAQEIEFLLSQDEIDLWKLREFALTPGGLVNGRYSIRTVKQQLMMDQLQLLKTHITLALLFIHTVCDCKTPFGNEPGPN